MSLLRRPLHGPLQHVRSAPHTWINRCNRSTISAQERSNFLTFIRTLAERRRKRPVGKERILDFFPDDKVAALVNTLLEQDGESHSLLYTPCVVCGVFCTLMALIFRYLLQYIYSLFCQIFIPFIQKRRQNAEGARGPALLRVLGNLHRQDRCRPASASQLDSWECLHPPTLLLNVMVGFSDVLA